MAEEADRLVARAIESVLDQVPGHRDSTVPEMSTAKLQPWAETAAPVGTRGKRPLDDLLEELQARVTAAPDAQVSRTPTRHPGMAFFDRFRGPAHGPGEREAVAEAGGGRRRRRRRGGSGGGAEPNASTAGAATGPRQAGDQSGGTGRRRSRRGRGRGGGPREGEARGGPAAGSRAESDGANPPAPGRDGESRPSGSRGGRRRRGRRGRGGQQSPEA